MEKINWTHYDDIQGENTRFGLIFNSKKLEAKYFGINYYFP